jgi:hypothetical protein
MITPEGFQEMTDRMRPLGASESPGAGAHPRQGQVLWGGATERGLVGMAWDWIEMQRDVIVMLDPMTVLSNAVFVDDRGQLLAENNWILYLNNAVHDIEWQKALLRPSDEPPVDARVHRRPAGLLPGYGGSASMAR